MDVVFVTLRSLSFEYGRQDSVLELGYMLIEWIYDVSILSQSKKKKFIFKLYFDQTLKIIIELHLTSSHELWYNLTVFKGAGFYEAYILHLLNISHCHYIVWQSISIFLIVLYLISEIFINVKSLQKQAVVLNHSVNT